MRHLIAATLLCAAPALAQADECTPLGDFAEICASAAGWTAEPPNGGDPLFNHDVGAARVIYIAFPGAAENGATEALVNIYVSETPNMIDAAEVPPVESTDFDAATFRYISPGDAAIPAADVLVSVLANDAGVILLETLFDRDPDVNQDARWRTLHTAFAQSVRSLP